MGMGLGNFYQPGQLVGKKTSEDVVTWMKYSEVLEGKTAAVPAYGVFPTRLAVVQLSFPLEEQLKEIQRALRLPTLRQAIQESSPERLFATDPVSGKIVPYTSLYTGTGSPAAPGGPLGGPRRGHAGATGAGRGCGRIRRRGGGADCRPAAPHRREPAAHGTAPRADAPR